MILAAPNAPEGTVAYLSSYDAKTFTPGSVVLCRNTSPLVRHAYALLQRSVPCTIAGKDIGGQLESLVKKLSATSLSAFHDKLASWTIKEASRAEAAGRSPEWVYDQSDALSFLSAAMPANAHPDLLVLRIRDLFSDGKDETRRVLLSTIHRAKGGEWATVFLLDFAKLLPSRFARLPWQLQQEKNLCYVAVTRSSNSLFYINSDNWTQ